MNLHYEEMKKDLDIIANNNKVSSGLAESYLPLLLKLLASGDTNYIESSLFNIPDANEDITGHGKTEIKFLVERSVPTEPIKITDKSILITGKQIILDDGTIISDHENSN